MRTLLIPALAFGVLFLVTDRVRAADDTRAILEKAVKAHGGAEKLAKEQATQSKTKGTIDLAGGINFTEESFIQPGRLKSVTELEVAGNTIKVVTVFNGEKAWVQAGGKTTELDGKTLDEMKAVAYLTRLSPFMILKDKTYELSSLGELKINDRPTVGVKIAKKGERDISMFFDKETGLVTKIERQMVDPMTEKEISEERIITEYQEVDGIKIPKKAVVNRDGKKFMDVEVLEVKHREKFDDSEFAKP